MKTAFHTAKIRGASVYDLKEAWKACAFNDGNQERVEFIREKLVVATQALADAARTFHLLACSVEVAAKHREIGNAALFEAMEDKRALDAASEKPARRARGKRGGK